MALAPALAVVDFDVADELVVTPFGDDGHRQPQRPLGAEDAVAAGEVAFGQLDVVQEDPGVGLHHFVVEAEVAQVFGLVNGYSHGAGPPNPPGGGISGSRGSPVGGTGGS